MDEETNTLDKQPCPMCHTNSLTLIETKKEIPYFGVIYIFSMDCKNCDYHMADLESDEDKTPCKYTFDVETEADLSVRVVKSSKATIKIPRITTITPGPVSNGYVSNIESIINQVKSVIEEQRNDDDPKIAKKAKNLLKKIQRVLWGREKITITIEDPTGNSAIISEKAVKSKLK